MDYMVRLLIGAAQLVAADKAEAANRKRVEASRQEISGDQVDEVARIAAMAEWRGRHEAWLEAAVLLDRVSQQASSVPV